MAAEPRNLEKEAEPGRRGRGGGNVFPVASEIQRFEGQNRRDELVQLVDPNRSYLAINLQRAGAFFTLMERPTAFWKCLLCRCRSYVLNEIR